MRVMSRLDSTLLLPFQMMLDIGQQLSDDLYSDLKIAVFKDYFEVKTANDWINLEAFGNMTAVRAKALSHILKKYFQSNQINEIHVDLYLNDAPLTSDNLYSLLTLADEIHQLNLNLCLIAQNPINELQLNYLADKDNIIVKQIKELPPNRKWATDSIGDWLNDNRFSVLKEKGYSFIKCSNHYQFESSNLVDDCIGYAWSILKLGAYDVATNLLSTILIEPTLSKASQEHLLMHLQLIRFHAHQYEAVALEIYPEFQHLDDRSIQYIQYIKAYSATLSRHADVAETCFQACGVHQDMPIQDEFNVYQLNIFALYQVIKRQIDIAYQLEMKIENFIKNHPDASIGLKYVNNINIARLYKKLEQYDLSRQYYEQAYDELSGGGYTTSDYIYYNMNLGSLYEVQKKSSDALVCWVKAAMHWLVSKDPYSLAWRPKIILCQQMTADLNFPLSLKNVSFFLVNKIKSLLDDCQIHLKNSEPFSFELSEGRIQQSQAYIKDQFVIYGHTSEGPLPHTDMRILQGLLSDVIRYLVPITPSVKSIAVDYPSESLLRKHCSFWPLSLIHDCEDWTYNDESVKLDDIRTLKPNETILLKPSRLIKAVVPDENCAHFIYQRSFMNKVIHDDVMIEVFNALQEKPYKLVPNTPLAPKWVEMLYQNLLEFEYLS